MEMARDTWARRIRQWERSGLTAIEFAKANGLNAGTLSHWKWRITKEARAAKRIAERTSAGDDATFVELTLPSSWWRVSDRIEIVIAGEVVVRVASDFDAETLRRVLAVLGALEGGK